MASVKLDLFVAFFGVRFFFAAAAAAFLSARLVSEYAL